MAPAPFASCARRPGVGLVDLALALASEFRAVDHVGVDRDLAALTDALRGADRLAPVQQLEALSGVLKGFQPVSDLLSRRPLMLDAVLHERAGDPLLLALLATDVGRRAGLDVALAGGGDLHVVAHRSWNRPFAVRFDGPGARFARLSTDTLAWRCPHQVMRRVLGELVDRSRRGGDLSAAIRAAELRLELPLDRHGRQAAQTEVDALRAVLN